MNYVDESMRKESEANGKYNALLSAWSKNPAIISDKSANFPSFYGGAYIDDQQNLVIQVTDLTDEIKTYFSRIISLENVIFNKVKFSYLELLAEHSRIATNYLGVNSTNGELVSVGISQKENAINLYIKRGRTQDEYTAIANKITDFEHVRIVQFGTCQPCADVYPGTAISNRSVGFWGYANGSYGIITAAHNSIKEGDVIKIGSVVFGTAEEPHCENGGKVDAVFVKKTNTDFYSSNYVPEWDVTMTVGKYASSCEKSTIYCAGKVTTIPQDQRKGTVVDNAFVVGYDFDGDGVADVKIYDCVLTTAKCDNGDSGGIVMCSSSSDYLMAGIMIAKNSSESPSDMIYCKYANIYDAIGMTQVENRE